MKATAVIEASLLDISNIRVERFCFTPRFRRSTNTKRLFGPQSPRPGGTIDRVRRVSKSALAGGYLKINEWYYAIVLAETHHHMRD